MKRLNFRLIFEVKYCIMIIKYIGRCENCILTISDITTANMPYHYRNIEGLALRQFKTRMNMTPSEYRKHILDEEK